MDVRCYPFLRVWNKTNGKDEDEDMGIFHYMMGTNHPKYLVFTS